MRNTGLLGGVLAVLAVAAFILYSSVFTVHQNRQALVLQFGEVVRPRVADGSQPALQPGLHFKVPFIQNVVTFDKRILDLDTPSLEVIASDQKRLVVDAFARYRISDPLRFYQAVNTIERANLQLTTLLNSAVRRVLGEVTFAQVVRDERPQLMARIAQQLNQVSQGLGITVVDVKIRRADLPDANSQAVYDRMKTERQREAAEIRAQGEEASRRIRATADRDVAVILAEANRQGELLRGDGDAERSRIFAEAFTRDADFFAFYRSMQAYEAGLRNEGTRLVLTPDTDFFRYFQNPNGTTNARGPAPAPGGAVGATPPPQGSPTPGAAAAPPAPAAEGLAQRP